MPSSPPSSPPSSYVALGDSFTEGLDDVGPDGTLRGYADRVAEALAGRSHDPAPFTYANLAVRGKLTPQIVAEQVPLALELRPDLVSLASGTNDVLRRHCDLDRLDTLLDEAAASIVGAGARLLLFTSTDPSRRLPWARRLLPRVVELNAIAARLAARYDAYLVDLWTAPVFDDPRLWSVDRLHLSAEGHRRVALGALEQLGVPSPLDWRAPLPAGARVSWHRARGQDLAWLRRHVAPWMHRRLTGRSSGDARQPKRPTLAPLAVAEPAKPG